MRNRISVLAVFILLLSLPVEAQTRDQCKPLDLRSEFGPVRNQQSTGWCYAFAIADLLGHEIGLRPPEMISARDVATSVVSFRPTDAERMPPSYSEDLINLVSTYDGTRFDRRSGSHVNDAYMAYSSRGRMCMESQLPSQGLNYQTQWISQQINRYYTERGWSSRTIAAGASPSLDIMSCYLRPAPVDESARMIQGQFHNIATEGIRRETDEICPESDKFEGLNPRQFFVSEGHSKESIFAKGMEALDNGKPFIIDYKVKPFQKDMIVSVDSGGSYSIPREGGPHASVVVGRRWNESDNKCEVLVRNSWGPSCVYYRPDVECEHGHFWVSTEELTEQTRSIFKF